VSTHASSYGGIVKRMARHVSFRTCPLCEATCGLRIEIENGRVTGIRGDVDDPFSKGFICPKGSTLGALHDDPDRLRRPLVRRNGKHVEVTWDEAFAEVELRLAPIIATHGPDAVAVYIGNPNAHNFANTLGIRPLVKTLRTRNVYSASTVDQMPKHVACGLLYGHPFAIPVPDLDRTDLLLILGANPFESNGSLATAPDWPGRLEAIRRRGGRVVVVDPRRTRTAEHADVHIPIRPGTDAALLAGIANTLFAEGLAAPGPLADSVIGVDLVREAIAGFTPARVASFTGVPADTVVSLARELAAAPTAVVYGRIGTHTTVYGTLAAWLVDVLNVLTGNLDRPGGAMFPHAAHERPRRPPRPFRTGRWHSRVRGLPESLGELPVATLADEIEAPGAGQVQALLTIAGNPALTTPDAGRLDRLLAGLDVMVSVDPYLNATTRHADVILPPPSVLQKSHYDLAFTALSVRNVADFSPAVFEREQGSPSEFEILVRLAAIASGLGANADPAVFASAMVAGEIAKAVDDPTSPIHGRDPAEIEQALGDRPVEERLLDLMLRTGHRGDAFGTRPDGVSLAMLDRHPHGIDFGPLEPRIPDALATESGKVELAPPSLIADLTRLERALDTTAAGGMVLVGRRQLRTANSWTQNVTVLVRGKDSCLAQLHPDDADRLGLVDGATARVSSAAGSIDVPVALTDAIMPGVVCIPYGWGHGLPGTQQAVAAGHPGVNVNVLTDSSVIDPLSGNAVLNGIPVTIIPA
jgi:anaerobic selenocysteine-containing dehydrogenase